MKTFFFLESTCACVLGPWPWPRAFLFLASRVSVLGRLSLALASDFFCVLGLGLEPCVLDSTSCIYKKKSSLRLQFLKQRFLHCFLPGYALKLVGKILNWGGSGPLVVNIDIIANYCLTRTLLYGEILKETETEKTVGMVFIFLSLKAFQLG